MCLIKDVPVTILEMAGDINVNEILEFPKNCALCTQFALQ